MKVTIFRLTVEKDLEDERRHQQVDRISDWSRGACIGRGDIGQTDTQTHTHTDTQQLTGEDQIILTGCRDFELGRTLDQVNLSTCYHPDICTNGKFHIHADCRHNY